MEKIVVGQSLLFPPFSFLFLIFPHTSADPATPMLLGYILFFLTFIIKAVV